MQIELADSDFVDEGVNLTLQRIRKEDTRLDGTFTETGGTGLLDVDAHGRSDALTGDLHEAELRQWEDVVLGTVLLHVLTHALVEHLTILGQFHIDKVDDDDTSHIAQSQLACQLVGCSQIGLQGIGLLTVLLDTRSAVDVDDMHGLCVLDDEIGAVLVVDGLAEARFQLFGHIVVVEDGYRAIIELDDLLLLWCYQPKVVPDFLVDAAVVDVNAVIGRIEQVAKQGDGAAFLLKAHLWALCRLLYLRDGFLPAFQKNLHLGIKLCCTLAFSHRTHDDAEVLGLDALDELFESGALFATFDLRRDGNTILEGYQHDVTACETEFARQAWTFRVDRLLDDLYEYFLSYLERVGDAAVLLELGLDVSFLNGVELLAVADYLFQVFFVRVELRTQVEIMQKGHALGSDVNETSIEAGHQLFHFCHIDVTHRERRRALLLLVFHQLLVFEQGYGDVLRLHIDDNFTCHCLFAFLTGWLLKTRKGVLLSFRD